MSDQTQQTYPYDIMFQRYLLALAVQDPTFLEANRQCLSPDYFEDRSLKFLSATILGFFDNYHQVPAEAPLIEWVNNALRIGNKNDIAEVVTQTTAFLYRSEVPNADYVRDRALHFARRQGLKRAVLRGIDVLRKDGDPEDAMDMFEQAMSIGVAQAGVVDFWDVAAKIPQMWDEMIAARGAIPTRFMPTFDRALYGTGPRRGELYVIQAVPKAGKSMFLINLGAHAVTMGFKVLHITIGDLKEFDVAHRYASCITGVPMKTILGKDPAYIAQLRESFLEKEKLLIKYYSPYSLTATNIRSFLSWLKSTKGYQPDMLIIDYPDKMLFDRNNTYGELGRIYMELKAILDDFNCVGWIASQSNRSAANAGLNTTANMAESWDKVANADGIIPITRMDSQGKEVKESTKAELNFDGARTGHVMAYVENVRFGHDGFQIKIAYDYARCHLMEDSPVLREVTKTNTNLDAAQAAVARPMAAAAMEGSGLDLGKMVGPNG